MQVLLITPPMTQVNTPYPGTPYITSFLRHEGHEVHQADLGLELILDLFSAQGLKQIHEHLQKFGTRRKASDSIDFFLHAYDDYAGTIESVIRFLQGKDPTLALRLAERKLVPEGPRFVPLQEHGDQLLSVFGSLGTQDKAKYIASLYLDDLADVLRDGVDADFEFSRYGESLASSQPSFDLLLAKLEAPQSLVDQSLIALLRKQLQNFKPDVVGFTVPFPGNLYAALRMGQWVKKNLPGTKVVLGGGFINTELRGLTDARFFQFTDVMTFDDGELPLRQLFAYFAGKANADQLVRTKMLMDGKVTEFNNKTFKEIPFKQGHGPSYEGLPLDRYISMLEMPNPMHRMWSDFRWNKLILAHGCYWKRCAFCDVNLDYIGRFEPAKVDQLIEQMIRIQKETGSSGFHFVDEAAPPALLRALSTEIIKRKLQFTWWGNLRFDTQFDAELCELMADAGCVAVTGGLEVASPRILQLINKGISIEQVTKVTQNFRRAGIFVHAYLMYGFPSQTAQETIDSLETVRQLFRLGCLSSAHWHRFLVTVHSPVGKNPDQFGVQLLPRKVGPHGQFANYEVPFKDSVKTPHDQLGVGLRKALYNYMHQIGLDENVQHWFEFKVPAATLKPDALQRFLAETPRKTTGKKTRKKAGS